MTQYCLETRVDGVAVIHRLDCDAFDLATLLGLGCVVNLGQFATLAQALAAIRIEHTGSIPCPDCCKEQVMCLPLIRRNTLPIAINALSG